MISIESSRFNLQDYDSLETTLLTQVYVRVKLTCAM